jgi:cystathionine gamma-synthase
MIPLLQLAQLTTAKYGRKGELCILTPSCMTGESCCAFLASRSPTVPSRLVEYAIEARQPSPEEEESEKEHQCTITLHACFFAAEDFSIAKQFWQHTGDGISSRVAERCLIMLGELEADGSEVVHVTSPVVNGSSGISSRYGSKTGRYATKTTTPPSIDTIILPPIITSKSRYATNSLPRRTPSDCLPPSLDDAQADESILTRYVEERYGRNLDLSLAPIAKLAMRRRIAGVLKESASSKGGEASEAESTRGVGGLTEKDVWLYTTGMGAIFHAHQLAMAACERDGRVVGDSVCFGYVLSPRPSLTPC